MHETYDWTGFYRALCEHGPHLLRGINGDDGVREVIVAIAVSEPDTFWSDGLQDLLWQHAVEGDVRAGVLAALELWRENVLTALSDSFGLELDWDVVIVDVDSPLIGRLVEAASPEAP